MTDNFALIKDSIQSQWGGQFNDFTDAFYAVEIIGRRKDGTTIEARKFKTYFIKNIEDFDRYETEIKAICDTLQMRAYISVNVKSWRHVTLNTMAEYADRIAHDNFDKPQSVFESCVGKFVDRSAQLWIIDVDKDECEKFECGRDDLISYYRNIIENECEPKEKIVEIIPTKSGGHIICHPFNAKKFMTYVKMSYDLHHIKQCIDEESLIKKNNFTLLYENIK
jgi:hypothetical protein